MRVEGRVAWLAALLTAVACTRAPTATQRLAQVSTAIRLERTDEALELLDELTREPEAATIDPCKLLELRLVALAGRGRPEDLKDTLASLLARCPGSVGPIVVARTGASLLRAGADLGDVESLFAAVPGFERVDGNVAHDFLAARAAEQPGSPESLGMTEAQLEALMRFNCDFGGLSADARIGEQP